MPILRQEDRDAVRERFVNELGDEVTLTLYTQPSLGGLFIPGRECQTCAPTQELLEEVAELSNKVHLEIVDFYGNAEQAREQGIDQIPAILISGNGENNARYYGLPSGYEFAVLLDAIVAASSDETVLQPETVEQIKAIDEDVRIQVFVTPN